MHPILSRAERLAAYLGAWLVGCILLAAVFTRLGLGWVEALALLVPLFLIYSFVCLSAWYVCRATPLRTSSLSSALASSGLSAVVSGALWVALARGWIALLTLIPALAPAADRYDQQLPFLFASGVLLFLLALAVHYVLFAFEAVREAEHRQLELEILTREAELRALRAQLDPHFLYNSLNSISALTTTDPAGARRMCILLGEFLRTTLRVSTRERIPLADEVALAELFLSIEQVRFGSRLRIDRRIDEAASACLVPPLLLQPLVENAVTHGIAGLLEGGVIRLDISRQDGQCSIVLENPCEADHRAARTGGLGLDNVRRRLAAMFGPDARMSTLAETGRFRVDLQLPCATSHE